jgi:hypothetical protein
VADAYAAEYPDYQLMQVLAAVQPPQQTLMVVTKLSVKRPTEKAETLADELAAGGPTVFAEVDAQPLYADLRASLDERKVADYVEGTDSATAKLTVKDPPRPPAEAQLLLGADNYAKFRAPSRPTAMPPSPGPKNSARACRRLCSSRSRPK